MYPDEFREEPPNYSESQVPMGKAVEETPLPQNITQSRLAGVMMPSPQPEIVTSVQVTGFRDTQAFTEYAVETRLGDRPPTVAWHRYSDFARLHVDSRSPGAFPVDKLLFHTRNAKEERATELERYLKKLVAALALNVGQCGSPALRAFLLGAETGVHTARQWLCAVAKIVERLLRRC